MTEPQIRSEPEIALRNGSLYLSAAIYDRYFRGLNTLVMVKRDDRLLVMPVHHDGGGGMLVKIRNPSGDRVVHALEFLSFHKLENADIELKGQWDSELAALVLEIG